MKTSLHVFTSNFINFRILIQPYHQVHSIDLKQFLELPEALGDPLGGPVLMKRPIFATCPLWTLGVRRSAGVTSIHNFTMMKKSGWFSFSFWLQYKPFWFLQWKFWARIHSWTLFNNILLLMQTFNLLKMSLRDPNRGKIRDLHIDVQQEYYNFYR